MLYYDTFIVDQDKSKSTKLSWRQLGLYRVVTANSLKGIYTLEDIDRARLRGTFSGSRLKKFVQRDRYFRASDEKVVDVIEEEYLATTKRKVKELAEEEAQAGTLEQEIKGIENSTEVNKPLEYEQRVIIQLPRISERRKEQYVQFPNDQGGKRSKKKNSNRGAQL